MKIKGDWTNISKRRARKLEKRGEQVRWQNGWQWRFNPRSPAHAD